MPHATVNGTQLYYERAGAGAPPLVFVHGFGCAHEDWQFQVETFSARHMVVSCDLRGHGVSPGEPASCSIETYGADVAALARALNLSGAVIVGHSMGTRVVLQACLDAPDRVAGLVLVDGSFQAAAGSAPRRTCGVRSRPPATRRGPAGSSSRCSSRRAQRPPGSGRAPNGSPKRSARRYSRGWCAGTPATWRPRSAASACR
jgi:pimeloyl-ACP methyl ester carboxylesterase